MKKRFVEFIDRRHIAAVCTEEEDVEHAINICAKFCVSKFGLEACAKHPMEINNFCVSTLLFVKKKIINSGKDERVFRVRNDLFNALTLACHRGEHNLSIVGSIGAVTKKNLVRIKCNISLDDIPMSYNEDLHLATEIFTHTELTLLLELDGNITPYSLMRDYKLKRTEAETIKKNIQKKIIYLRLKI